MRAPYLMLPLTLALAAPLIGAAQEGAPRVLFCTGGCFAVDASGVRTPAPKGTALLPGQRLETAPGGYAQVKLGRDAAIGVGEQARIRFDRNAVVLDQGRVRMVEIGAVGKPIVQPVELRTADGVLVLRGADVEAKKTGIGKAAPTLVKLNAGDARLGKGPQEIQLSSKEVQGISNGKLMAAPMPLADIVPARATSKAPVARGPITLPPSPIRVSMPVLQPTTTLVLSPTLTTTLSTTTLSTATIQPVLTSGDLLLNSTVSSSTGTTTTLSSALLEPIKTTTTTTTSTTLSTTTLTSPTLSTSTLTLQPISTSTTTTCCTKYTFTIR